MNPSIALAFCPTGKLRAAINLGNPILARLDAASQPAGVSVDLARAYAGELGVELELVVVDAAGKSVDIVTQAQADIGFSPSIRARRGHRLHRALCADRGPYLVGLAARQRRSGPRRPARGRGQGQRL